MTPPNIDDLHRAVQWIMTSPSFFNMKETWDFTPGDLDRLDDQVLHRELKMLEGRLAETPLRMGRIFERLVKAIFMAHLDYEVLEHSVGIFNGKQQLTELDLLLETANGKGLHVEVSVKFYLYIEDEKGEMQVVGPNGRDVLENRMQKFANQLEHGKAYVKDKYPDIKFQHVVFSRGRIFEEEGGPRCAHPLIAKNCEKGVWMSGRTKVKATPMNQRWEWIAWPPNMGENEIEWFEEEEPTHLFKLDGPIYQHLIIMPKTFQVRESSSSVSSE